MMKAIIIIAAITLSGCLHEKPYKEALYCDGMHIATGDLGIRYYETSYFYNVNGQGYIYTPIQGSVCKRLEIE
jgi:hypothetical protein